ncbi:MAG: nitrous oxide-stimulated promoter family protein [Coriobacteriaceae bacterium]|nr:nitrous oxide-stimulated promoter family protein [Coriobacteriaceae bacterium]
MEHEMDTIQKMIGLFCKAHHSCGGSEGDVAGSGQAHGANSDGTGGTGEEASGTGSGGTGGTGGTDKTGFDAGGGAGKTREEASGTGKTGFGAGGGQAHGAGRTIEEAGGAGRRLSPSRRVLCPECQELLAYAQERIERCPYKESKTFCSQCATHCYRPHMREKIRTVMRYSGPRMLWHDPPLAVRHLLARFHKP